MKRLKQVLIEYKGDAHEPRHFKLVWGRHSIFKGRVTEFSITYKLFNPDGTPIRAVAKVKFKSSIEEQKRAAKEDKSSPDLTHVHQVKAGDTLPLMCYRIYGDPNTICSGDGKSASAIFGVLKPGQDWFFHPSKKQVHPCEQRLHYSYARHAGCLHGCHSCGRGRNLRPFHVLSIAVTRELNRIPSATIHIQDGEASKATFAASNTDHFIPGKKIEIQLGYRSQNDSVFKGIVVKHSIKIRKNGSLLIVECRDEAVKMTSGAKSHYYTDKKDSDIMEEIIGSYQLHEDDASHEGQSERSRAIRVHRLGFSLMPCRSQRASGDGRRRESKSCPTVTGGGPSLRPIRRHHS